MRKKKRKKRKRGRKNERELLWLGMISASFGDADAV
jgi:hypothetical protein